VSAIIPRSFIDILQACFKFMSHLLREKQFIALGDSWVDAEDEGAAVVGKEERVGILRGGQLRVFAPTPGSAVLLVCLK
jgi:hypothetical protein